MRRLWLVMAICGLAAACGRPNPGFKLIDSSDVSDSDGQSGSVGLTDTGVVTGTPTSTEATGTTTASGGSMSSTVSTSDPTSDTESSTTLPVGMHWEFPGECPELEDQISAFVNAAADTFFLYEFPLSECSWFLEMGMTGPDCVDLEFSQVEAYQVYQYSGDPGSPDDDVVALYGVRFNRPMFMANVEIPDYAYVSIDAKIRLAPWPNNPKPWTQVVIEGRHFGEGDGDWTDEGGLEYTPCFAPASSYRCHICPAGEKAADSCMMEWGHPGMPYDPADPRGKAVAGMKVDLPGPDDYLTLPFPASALPWLQDGLILKPADDLVKFTVEVKTLQSATPPGLDVVYCKPELVPDN